MAASIQAHYFYSSLKACYQFDHSVYYCGFKLATSTFVLSIKDDRLSSLLQSFARSYFFACVREKMAKFFLVRFKKDIVLGTAKAFREVLRLSKGHSILYLDPLLPIDEDFCRVVTLTRFFEGLYSCHSQLF